MILQIKILKEIHSSRRRIISESSVKIVILDAILRDRERGRQGSRATTRESRRARLAGSRTPPDDETNDVFNTGDSESREETITMSATVSSQSAKDGTKTKKKKIEGIAQSHSPQELQMLSPSRINVVTVNQCWAMSY